MPSSVHPARRRVVVTGLGLLTPFGVGVETLWDALVGRRSAVRQVESLAAAGLPVTFAAPLPALRYEDWLEPKAAAMWGRASQAAVVAALEAWRDAGTPQVNPARAGVLLGTGYGGLFETEATLASWAARGWRGLKPITVPQIMANAPASLIALRLGLRGLNFSVSTACSSGALALGLAAQQVRAGALDACLAGGVDVLLNASTAGAWCALRVLSRREDPSASRPFSADRDGLVLAEAAALLLLEEREQALERGARVYAELCGSGANNDAHSLVEPDTAGELEAMRLALEDAGLEAGAIDFVNAHGTATAANDASESRALKALFGSREACPPVFSIKGHVGHSMGAAGAVEAAVTALALERGWLPPTLHYTPGDPECDLDYVADGPRRATPRYGLSNSFGFGGQNSVLIFARGD